MLKVVAYVYCNISDLENEGTAMEALMLAALAMESAGH
jgi:hypothetical protein